MSNSLLHTALRAADKIGLIDSASAHCDIPCGIYDPGPALIAAVSVVRMMDIMLEAGEKEDSVGKTNLLVRNTMTKEEEAEKVKHEIRVIWGDYFKSDLIEKHANIHHLTHQIMQKASACKQDVHREDALALLELVNQFAEIFWQTKGVETERKNCPYKPNLPVVTPNLD